MGWLGQAGGSSVGGKLIVAVTGLGLVGFLVAHLAGNCLVFAGPEAMAAYAEGLHHYPALLWTLRIGLIAMALAHVTFAIKLNLASRAARPVSYARKDFRRATLASRQMVLTGLLVLAYVGYHLAHFTFRITSPELQALGPYDVHRMVVISFSNPVVSAMYLVAMAATGLHLSHGISSLFQTLGLRQPKYDAVTRRLGPLLGWLLAAGFGSIPLAVLVGLVK